MVRRHAVPAASEGVIVTQVGPRFAEAAGGDIIGKESAEPERVVPEMHHHLEAAIAGSRLEVRQNVDHVAVLLVVVPVDSPSSIPLSEFQEQGGEIVGELALFQAGAPERMPHDYVEKQRL